MQPATVGKKKTLMQVKWGEKNVMHTQVLGKKILENPTNFSIRVWKRD